MCITEIFELVNLHQTMNFKRGGRLTLTGSVKSNLRKKETSRNAKLTFVTRDQTSKARFLASGVKLAAHCHTREEN